MIIRDMIESLSDEIFVDGIDYLTVKTSIFKFCGKEAANYLESVTLFKNNAAYLPKDSIDEVCNTILDLAKVATKDKQ